ncbi:hypothetical protein WB44_06430 [Synechococcus sp. WH 8020]|uniref:hypothetical protein n=1 Tax=unclassified Synechococcus TaxID=2626047 RepID=UPI00065278D2|nr:hypothetical protein [Synechococcus sp. WH 8020]AKN60790.1 hypothetical protein WB44_06430 [Synechococcus sp. WH 8020]
MATDPALVTALVERVHAVYGAQLSDVERQCWTVVHEYHHGAMPTEYDIREVSEDLYLAVLEATKQSQAEV